MQNKLLILIMSGLIGLLTGSCRKEAIRDQEKELKRMEGVWNVDYYEVQTYDTTGQLISTTRTENTGTVEFKLSMDYKKGSSEIFNNIYFLPPALPGIHEYFSNKGAGDISGSNFVCQWEVDPDQKRILFWATGPLSNWHLTFDLEMEGKGKKKRVMKLITASRVEIYGLSKN